MTTDFVVITTSHFERELIIRSWPGNTWVCQTYYRQIIDTLKTDPYNRSNQHAIKKLTAVPVGEGQYRIRLGRFRFRYDIEGQTVYLKACSLRQEDTYR